jgi:DNA-binding NtrC family response regulator
MVNPAKVAGGSEKSTVAEILLIDSEDEIRRQVQQLLADAGHHVTPSSEFESAVRLLAEQRHDAVVVSLDWPDRENAKRVRALRRSASDIPVMLLCTPEHIDQAVGALRQGADDYLIRPPDPIELQARLARVLEKRNLDSRIAFYQSQLSKRSELKSVEARSSAMRAALARVLRVAPMRSTVLIFGESGVGKELVARSIHFNSPRRERPFIALNCAAIAPNLIETELFGHEKGSFTGAHQRVRGKFEIADHGTLFLDEIGEMDPSTQAKLLRVLEQREFMRVGGDQSIRVDVRVIAATNANLEKLVAERSFRRDLYYRLKVVTINVPPLRERRDDIPQLVMTFLEELSRENAIPRRRITPEAMSVLQDYQWPGNVRELKNILESVLVSVPGESIRADDLPRPLRGTRAAPRTLELEAGTTLAEMERELIRRTLEHTGGNRTHSAQLLGIGVRTLQRKIRTYGISVAPKRRRSKRRDVLVG